ncbi:MAG: hypothetical protein ABL958_09765 [Bdellovibrionia bacterium]
MKSFGRSIVVPVALLFALSANAQENQKQSPPEQTPPVQNPPPQKRPPLGGKYDKGAEQGRQQWVDGQLKQFRQNSKQYMNQNPVKYAQNGKEVQDKGRVFSQGSQTDRQYVDSKYQWRQSRFGKGGKLGGKPPESINPFSEIQPNDRAQWLAQSENLITNLREMDNLGLRRGQINKTPWSGDYWPFYQGAIAARHFDPQYPLEGQEYLRKLDYANQNHFLDIFNTGDQAKINQLSAAEKYDLLTGDSNAGLTNHVWSEGKRIYEQHGGNMERWMGYCHGWAPASYMLARPSRALEVTSFDGNRKVKFYPAELKGLASFLWAVSGFESRFIGGRCNAKKPETDEVGRVLDPNCVDTNSGTWHLSIVNQVGQHNKPFIMDATYDYEVWNQPVVSYDYVYFNPQTYSYANSLREAAVSRDQFSNDKFSRYRSSRTAAVAGVAMRVTYLVETSVNDNETDSPERDLVRSVQYLYDLELDQTGNILGGEWYNNNHPDFLWTPMQNARAMAQEDQTLIPGDWDGQATLPLSWKRAAQQASGRGEVLANIVEKLIEGAANQAPAR